MRSVALSEGYSVDIVLIIIVRGSAKPALKRDMLSGNCPGPSAAVSRDPETEMLLHRREIAVVM